MNKILLYLTAFFFFSSLALAESVNKINISGNKRVSDETVKIYGDIDIREDIS